MGIIHSAHGFFTRLVITGLHKCSTYMWTQWVHPFLAMVQHQKADLSNFCHRLFSYRFKGLGYHTQHVHIGTEYRLYGMDIPSSTYDSFQICLTFAAVVVAVLAICNPLHPFNSVQWNWNRTQLSNCGFIVPALNSYNRFDCERCAV